MIIENTSIRDIYIITPEASNESHRWYNTTYSWTTLHTKGIQTLFTVDMQATIAFQKTLRGLYYQNEPCAQCFLIRCVRGAILQAAVDIRMSSETYGKWVLEEISEQNAKQLYIPKGFAQGFLTLSDDVIIQYKSDKICVPELEHTLNYADPEVGIEWPEEKFIISIKDKCAPSLSDIPCNYL